MKKFKKMIAMCLAAVMAMSVMSMSAFAAETPLKIRCVIKDALTGERLTENTASTPEKGIVLDGELGQTYKSGGIVYKIVGKDGLMLNDNNNIVPYSSKVAFNVILGGTTRRHSFTLSGNYKYWKVWFENTQAKSDRTIVTINDSNGNQIGDVAYVPGGTIAQLYSDEDSPFPADTYKVNFTSGNANLSGQAACRLATTWAELDVSE